MSIEDSRHLAHALRLAERGRYSCHPNPRVGCVIVHAGSVIGEGYHIKAGAGHAEVNALAHIGNHLHNSAHSVSGVNSVNSAKGATAYITLEPCSFQGRTPSCAQQLIESGIQRAVIAMPDPDPRNAGKGIDMLRQAGIEVTSPLLEDAARALNPGHIKRHQTGLPWVRLKLAMSLDGKTALATGASQWITTSAARLDVQRLRAESSAIVTGVQTVIDDDPLLSVRDEEINIPHFQEAKEIARPVYILDPQLRTPSSAALRQQEHTLIVTLDTAQAVNDSQDLDSQAMDDSQLLIMPVTAEKKIDLHALLEELARREHSEVLFESGQTLAGAMIAARLVDEIVLYIAPCFLGDSARSLLRLPEIDRLSERWQLAIKDIQKIDSDFKVTATLV